MLIETCLSSATGCQLYVCCQRPAGKPRAVVQFLHGMAEHIHRYDRFARFLAEHDVAFVGCDLPGHGKSVGEDDTLGYFAPADGWNLLLEDVHRVLQWGKSLFPDIPYVLMGHGLGSFLVRTYVIPHEEDADAYILSGTSGRNPCTYLGKVMAEEELKNKNPRTPGRQLDALFTGRYNAGFEPARTPADWRSTDPDSVDSFLADPLCGFLFTIAGFRDLFDGLIRAQKCDWVPLLAKKPIFLCSGDCDPISGAGGSLPIEHLSNIFRHVGGNVTLRIYEGCRHDLLQERNYRTVQQDILQFVNGLSDPA